MAVSVIKSDYKDVSDKITVTSAWTALMKKAWIDGNTFHFMIEATASIVAGGTQYTVATIASGYRPKTNYAFTGHATNGSYLPQSFVNCFVGSSGDIIVRFSNGNGNYAFISGEYPLA